MCSVFEKKWFVGFLFTVLRHFRHHIDRHKILRALVSAANTIADLRWNWSFFAGDLSAQCTVVGAVEIPKLFEFSMQILWAQQLPIRFKEQKQRVERVLMNLFSEIIVKIILLTFSVIFNSCECNTIKLVSFSTWNSIVTCPFTSNVVKFGWIVSVYRKGRTLFGKFGRNHGNGSPFVAIGLNGSELL